MYLGSDLDLDLDFPSQINLSSFSTYTADTFHVARVIFLY